MTILFGGGEIGAFTPADNNCYEKTGSDLYDSSFARCAIACDGGSTYGDSFEFAGQTDIWLHHELRGDFNIGAQACIRFLNSSGADVAQLVYTNINSTTDRIQMQQKASGSWVDAGSSIDIGKSTRQTLDWHITIGASGSLVLYLSGTQRATSGTINLSALTNVAQVRLLGAANTYHSQIVGATESTIGWRLKTVPATAAGATTDWVGGYTEIDETVYSDADFVNSATNGQVELFSHSITVPTGYKVKAAIVTARAKCGASGPQNLQLALRSGGTTYFSSSKALDAGYGSFVEVWETDPSTAAAFTASAITTLQFGVKAIT